MIKEPFWPLSQAKLNIEKVLFGCVTGQTQDSTRALPLALFLLLSCLLCVYVHVTVHRCGSEGSGSWRSTSLLRLSSRCLYPLSYLTNTDFDFTSRSYKLSRLALDSLCSIDRPWIILHAWVFYVYASMNAYCVQAWHLGVGRGDQIPGTGVRDGCEPPRGCWGQDLGPFQEHPVLLIPEPSLHPLVLVLHCFSAFLGISGLSSGAWTLPGTPLF